jgi:hypothetical protein
MSSLERICIMTTSASRPYFLGPMIESLQKHITFPGVIHWLVHEDVIDDARSKECVSIVQSCPWSEILAIDSPPVGQGHSITKNLSQVDTPYVLNWEDDFTMVRDVDLGRLVQFMDDYSDNVNQICFNKRQTMSEKPGFPKKEMKFGDITLTTNPHWALIPALWRMSYILPRWVDFGQGAHWDLNRGLKGGNKSRDADWVISNTKTYYYGPVGENAYSCHNGAGHSLREGTEQGIWKEKK